MASKTVSVILSEEEIKQIKNIAEQERRSFSFIARELITQSLNQKNKENDMISKKNVVYD